MAIAATVLYSNDTWGGLLSVKAANGNAITDENDIGHINPIRYRGYYYDTDTGLYYLKARYYDPVTHRFISADSYMGEVGAAMSHNLFTYCGNNPVMYFDPSGHSNELSMAFAKSFKLIGMLGFLYELGIRDFDGLDTYEQIESVFNEITSVVSFSRGNPLKGPRKDPRKDSQNRQQSGDRERNRGHKDGEEHSRTPKGNGNPLKRFLEYSGAMGVTAIVISLIAKATSGDTEERTNDYNYGYASSFA